MAKEPFFLDKNQRIYVAGHKGMVGSAIWELLQSEGYKNLIGWTSEELDLTDRDATISKLTSQKPEVIILAAARVGGIGSNNRFPVEFLTENTRIQNNVFEAAHLIGVDRLLFLGSSCIYPKMSPQPIKEEYLLTGQLEKTNNAYAIAKIAGVLHIQGYRREYLRNWVSVMPTNLYGPRDNFDIENGHVLPSLISKFHNAKVLQDKSVTLWGDGSAFREFLHVQDLARACVKILAAYNEDAPINVGFGVDVEIRELAFLVREIVGFEGKIIWDTSKPNGTPRKLLDSTKILSLGWRPIIELKEGIQQTYSWFLTNCVRESAPSNYNTGF